MAWVGRRPGRWAAAVGTLCCLVLAVLVAASLGRGGASSADDAVSTPPLPEVPAGPPVVVFIGDSWTEGIGATALRGFADLAGEQAGWEYYVLGVGGSGYVSPGRGSTFDDRVERAVATHPDLVVVQGSINDRSATPEELERATLRTLRHLRTALDPDTEVLVLGASCTPGLGRPLVDGINDTVAAAAERVGVRFVDPAAENWNDPDVPGIWADDAHPDDGGHQLIADRLVPLLERMLGD